MTVDLFSSSSPPERTHGFCLWIPRVACTQCFKKFGLSWEIKYKSQSQRCPSEQYSLGCTVHKAVHLQHPERDIPPRFRRRPRGALSGAQQLRRCTWGRPLTSWRGASYEPPCGVHLTPHGCVFRSWLEYGNLTLSIHLFWNGYIFI